jgi:hypothetical protein
MIEVAEIFRLHGPDYRAQFTSCMLPSHLRAMQDIEQCRTATLGGRLYFCTQCQEQRYSYHSCKNRHCPKCGNQQANEWLQQQQNLLLPIPYFMVTFTLPQELRPLARSNQKTIYNLLFRASSQALLKLAQDPRFVGGSVGLVGVLQTWTRQLIYHPHVHYLVTGGGLTQAGRWRSSRADFLLHEKPLAMIFRAKLRDALKQVGFFHQVDRRLWKKRWVVDCEPVGNGAAAFKYLAPYIFRVAISNQRILKLKDGQVTFKYKESATAQIRFCTVSAPEFIRRFLQHVLPARFVKVRYYGLLAPRHRHLLGHARQLLAADGQQPPPGNVGQAPINQYSTMREPLRCHHCGHPLTLLRPLKPRGRSP